MSEELLEELRLEGLKSARLEDVVAKLMDELRAAKLHAAAAAAGPCLPAIDALGAVAQRAEAALGANAAAVHALEVTVRKGLDTALGRIVAEQQIDASIGSAQSAHRD